ncbi:MAG: PEP-CTERM sorting domain-containing protein [Kiritimatiellia bacterium]
MTMMKHLKKVLMALLLAAGMTGSVNGALLYYDVADVDIDDPNSYTYNPLTGTGAFGPGGFGLEIVPGDYAVVGGGGGQILTSNGSSIIRMDGTETIDAASGTWGSGFKSFFDMPVGDTDYFGIRYDAGSGYGYGWIQVQHDVDRDAILLASAFNEGAPITAGQGGGGGGEGGSAVPEPGTAAMLTIGVAILSASRRRFRREG